MMWLRPVVSIVSIVVKSFPILLVERLDAARQPTGQAFALVGGLERGAGAAVPAFGLSAVGPTGVELGVGLVNALQQPVGRQRTRAQLTVALGQALMEGRAAHLLRRVKSPLPCQWSRW